MKKTVWILLLATVWVLFGLVQAGELEPSAPPAPTMYTLEEIYAKLGGLVPGAIGLGATGLTECWDEFGTLIDCAGTGQDGEHQAGFAVTPRFTDNFDGTVRDNLTGLIWLKDANCFSTKSWADAISEANALAESECGLTDGSVAGDWRVPNLRELESLLDYGQGDVALPLDRPFTAVQSWHYWSSTTLVGTESSSWYIDVDFGNFKNDPKTSGFHVWPVRYAN